MVSGRAFDPYNKWFTAGFSGYTIYILATEED